MAHPPFPSPGYDRSFCHEKQMDRRKRAGFTLVETALALGIVAFALVPLIGLLPIGMQASRHASDLTIASQIAQRLSGMVAQDNFSDFSALVNGTSNLEGNLYYFDSEGQPITTNSQGQTLAANASPPANAVYTACIAPGIGTAGAQPTPMPSPNTNTQVNGSTTATLILQIAADPAHLWTTVSSPPASLKARTVTIPVYFGGSGG